MLNLSTNDGSAKSGMGQPSGIVGRFGDFCGSGEVTQPGRHDQFEGVTADLVGVHGSSAEIV